MEEVLNSNNDEAYRLESKMEKMVKVITFLCPSCTDTFEFDDVGEYQLVPCPICGSQWMTIRKDQILVLESFDFSQKTNNSTKQSAR